MKIEISISKDLQVTVNIDDELINQKKEIKWEFWIHKKGAWDKAIEELNKQAKLNS